MWFQFAHGGFVSTNNCLYERLQGVKFRFLIFILKVRQHFHTKGRCFFLLIRASDKLFRFSLWSAGLCWISTTGNLIYGNNKTPEEITISFWIMQETNSPCLIFHLVPQELPQTLKDWQKYLQESSEVHDFWGFIVVFLSVIYLIYQSDSGLQLILLISSSNGFFNYFFSAFICSSAIAGVLSIIHLLRKRTFFLPVKAIFFALTSS